MAKQYEVWMIEADGTYGPVPGGSSTFTSKVKAERLARGLARSSAFADCAEIGVVLDDQTVASFPVRVRT